MVLSSVIIENPIKTWCYQAICVNFEINVCRNATLAYNITLSVCGIFNKGNIYKINENKNKFKSLKCFQSTAVIKITNVRCDVLAPESGYFQECKIRAISRNKYSVNIKYYLLQDVNSVNVRFAFVRKLNGWKPHLYNFTFDGCDFLQHPNRYPLIKFVYTVFRKHINVNHTCPYKVFKIFATNHEHMIIDILLFVFVGQ